MPSYSNVFALASVVFVTNKDLRRLRLGDGFECEPFAFFKVFNGFLCHWVCPFVVCDFKNGYSVPVPIIPKMSRLVKGFGAEFTYCTMNFVKSAQKELLGFVCK